MVKLDLDFFETVIIYKCLSDEIYLASIVDILELRFFKDKNNRDIYNIIKDFYTKRSTKPTLTEIKSYLNTDELKASCKVVVNKFVDLDKKFNNDELYNNTEIFLKEKAVYHTMMDTVDDIGKNSIDTSAILNKFDKACSISLTTDAGLDLFPDIEKVIQDLNREDNYISSKWKWLDERLGGGFLESGRSIYVFAGETNIGKSIFLGNVAVNIASQNKTVLLITLEMPEMVYAKRLYTNITKIPFNHLKPECITLKNQIEGYTAEKPGAKILVKEFPPSTITTNHLKAFIKKLTSKGLKIDAIVLDYINLLHTTMGSNTYERIKYCTEQLRALTYVFNCPVISATQLNREGYNTSDPGLNTISESMGLAATADVIMSIWQEDTDRELGVIKLGIMKNRFGTNFGHCIMRVDYSTLTISEDEHVNDTEASTSTINSLASLSNN
jgi:replicative DNA helicase